MTFSSCYFCAQPDWVYLAHPVPIHLLATFSTHTVPILLTFYNLSCKWKPFLSWKFQRTLNYLAVCGVKVFCVSHLLMCLCLNTAIAFHLVRYTSRSSTAVLVRKEPRKHSVSFTVKSFMPTNIINSFGKYKRRYFEINVNEINLK